MGFIDWFKEAAGIEPTPEPTSEPRIVSAAFTAAAHKNHTIAKEIEDSMAAAIKECMDRGVSLDDTVAIKRSMLNARARILNKYRP